MPSLYSAPLHLERTHGTTEREGVVGEGGRGREREVVYIEGTVVGRELLACAVE